MGLKWEQIVDLFPSRSRDSLARRWQMYLSGGSQGSKGSSPKGQPFTEDENKQILRLRNVQKLGWTRLQKFMPERGIISLRNHYYHLMGDKPRPSVKQVLKSSPYWDRIQKLVAEGQTTTEIALQTGLSNPHVSRIRRMLKAPTSRTKSFRVWKDAEVEQARLLKHDGKAYVEIANQLGRSYDAIVQLFSTLKHSKKYLAPRKEVEKPPK